MRHDHDPKNILVARDETQEFEWISKLADFGLAREIPDKVCDEHCKTI